MKPCFDFKGKTVVITGAAGFICRELAIAFAECGAKVAALDQNAEGVKKLAEDIRKENGVCEGFKADVLDKESLSKVHSDILHQFGSCDILINGAGGNNAQATTDNECHNEAKDRDKTFFDLTDSGIDFVFSLNFKGTLLPIKEFAGDMVKRKSGVILNISSMNAITPLTKIPAYSAAKAGVSNFTKWLATYFARSGIRCNAIAPGFLVSEQNKTLLFDGSGNPTKRSEKILRNTPMQRFLEAREMAGATLMLCDDSLSSAITGVILPIDGGFSAYSGV